MENFNKQIWETFGEKFENVNTRIQKADTYKAVSYTHLDVYKRQVQCTHLIDGQRARLAFTGKR